MGAWGSPRWGSLGSMGLMDPWPPVGLGDPPSLQWVPGDPRGIAVPEQIFFIGIYVCKMIQSGGYAGPRACAIRPPAPPVRLSCHAIRHPAPPPVAITGGIPGRPALAIVEAPLFMFLNIFYFYKFSIFGQIFPDPPGGPGGCGSGFCALRNVFQRKIFIIFFIIFFYKNVYKCLFRPSGDLPDLSGQFRTYIFIYLMYLSIYKYIYIYINLFIYTFICIHFFIQLCININIYCLF